MDRYCGKYDVALIEHIYAWSEYDFFFFNWINSAFVFLCGPLNPTHCSCLLPVTPPLGFLTLPNRPLGCSSFTLPTCTCQTSPRRTRVHCESASPVLLLSSLLSSFIISCRMVLCTWSCFLCHVPRYLINFLLDATLGMLVIYGGVKAVSAVVEWRQWDSLRFGEYGKEILKFHFLLKYRLNLNLKKKSCSFWEF